MDQFGEIRITKLEPESAVAWEGEHARGTITLEASGWGTKVSLTAQGVGSGGVDGTGPEAAAQAEPGPLGDLVAPAPPERLVEPARPDSLAESAPLERLEPARPDSLAESAPLERLDPPHEIKAQTPDRTIPPERDWLRAPMQRAPWTRRLADALRRWFGPPPPQDSDPLVPVAAEPRPSEPVRPLPPLAPAAMAAVKPPSLPEPPPAPITASTAALDAALDSLGQAHHRPYSRA